MAVAMKPDGDVFLEMSLQTRYRPGLPATMNWWQRGAWIALLVTLGVSCAAGQAMVEYGHTTAAASAASSAARTVGKVIALPAKQAGLTLPRFRQGENAEVANREALAAHAGKHSAKLMLRSIPNRAWVRIDGMAVGRTPLLLIVAPGVYAVEMEGGARLETSRRRVGLLPGETREVVLPLTPHYPAHIRISWPSHHAGGQGA